MFRRRARKIDPNTKKELAHVNERIDKVERRVNYLQRQFQLARRQA